MRPWSTGLDPPNDVAMNAMLDYSDKVIVTFADRAEDARKSNGGWVGRLRGGRVSLRGQSAVQSAHAGSCTTAVGFWLTVAADTAEGCCCSESWPSAAGR